MVQPLPQGACAQLQQQLRTLATQLEQDQAMLARLINSHAPQAQIAEWQHVVSLKAEEIDVARRTYETQCVGPHPSLPMQVTGWSLYCNHSIQPLQSGERAAGVRWAGHVNAIAAVGAGDILVGADSGGVWHLSAPQNAPTTVQATPLSDDWDSPDVRCLTVGPDGPGHMYAGCRANVGLLPVVYEAPPATPNVWQPIYSASNENFTVFGIGIATGRRIVIATTSGVFWAAIPDVHSVGASRAYQWQTAVWPSGAVACTGLVIANGLPVVSAAAGGTIWHGTWDTTGRLVMTQGFAGVADAGRSSLAVMAGNQQVLWCVIASSSQGTINTVARSTTAGQSWQMVAGTVSAGSGSTSLPGAAGGQGEYNNCIAASPVDQGTALIGWQSGVFVTNDGGQHYTHWTDQHIHADVHALYFDPRDRSGRTLFIGSDGGVVQTSDSGATFTSNWDQSLADLQFESLPTHDFFGTMSADPTSPGRVAAGLQDNGVVWSDGGDWNMIGGGDGGAAMFVASGALVSSSHEGAANLFMPGALDGQSGRIPPRVDAAGTVHTDGLPNNPIMEAVRLPAASGRRMFAVGGNGAPAEPNVVYGLRYSQPTGADAQWEYVATLPTGIALWSLAAANEATVYAGTQPAHVYAIDVATKRVTELTGLPTVTAGTPDPQASITRLVITASGGLLAAYNTGVTGQILAWDRSSGAWSQLSGGATGLAFQPIFGLDVDDWGAIYAATDDRLYVAPGVGHAWRDVSSGLPKRAHLGTLRFVSDGHGAHALYLATFGRSLWRANWQAAP
jgi:hypothetical protein